MLWEKPAEHSISRKLMTILLKIYSNLLQSKSTWFFIREICFKIGVCQGCIVFTLFPPLYRRHSKDITIQEPLHIAKYLDAIKINTTRSALARYRCSSHNLYVSLDKICTFFAAARNNLMVKVSNIFWAWVYIHLICSQKRIIMQDSVLTCVFSHFIAKVLQLITDQERTNQVVCSAPLALYP